MKDSMFQPILLTAVAVVAVATDQTTDQRLQQIEITLQQIQDDNLQLRAENQVLRRQIIARIDRLERTVRAKEATPYNTTIEELEIRVERLEEDMFEAEVAINDVEGAVSDVEGNLSDVEDEIDELQYTLQETIETDERLQEIETILLQQQNAIQQLQEINQQLCDDNNHIKLNYETLLEKNVHLEKRVEFLEGKIKQGHTSNIIPYNVTIEELEIRVERLEEDMFEAEVDIESLQFSLQETIETVMDHADNLDQLEQDTLDLNTNLEQLENRTSLTEQILLGTKDSAFLATLSSDLVFEETVQLIVFDNAKINEGGHYNNTTGRYTAPVSGIYQIFVYVRASPKARLRIYVDGSNYANPIEDDEVNGNYGEGASITVKLQAGQTVDVRTGDEPYSVQGDAAGLYTWFGGYLLFPETD